MLIAVSYRGYRVKPKEIRLSLVQGKIVVRKIFVVVFSHIRFSEKTVFRLTKHYLYFTLFPTSITTRYIIVELS